MTYVPTSLTDTEGWQSQHWSPPKLHESTEPYNQTLLELRMIDLFPAIVMETLRDRFGADFERLNEDGRVALALATSEGTVNHARLCSVSSLHPVEVTRVFRSLVQLGMLSSTGSGSGTVYFLTGEDLPTPDDVFGPAPKFSSVSSSGLSSSSSGLSPSSSDLSRKSFVADQNRDEHGYLHTDQLVLPVIDDLLLLSPALRQRLNTLAAAPQSKKKMDKRLFEQVILNVCEGHFLTLQVLAQLLNRSADSLRNSYLTPMVRGKALTLAFPATPTHERQAYCSTRSLPES